MNDPNETQPLSLREAARGVAVRAGILSAVAVVAGTFLFGLAAKAASGLVKVLATMLLLAGGGGFVAWKIRKWRNSSWHPATNIK